MWLAHHGEILIETASDALRRPFIVHTAQSSYALTSLMARYQISPPLSASVNVNNLFDKEYAAGLYGAPRNFMTTLRYAY